jgi:hypothetical protein
MSLFKLPKIVVGIDNITSKTGLLTQSPVVRLRSLALLAILYTRRTIYQDRL